MKTLTSLFTLLFSIVAYGAVPLGAVPYAQLDTNDFGVTVAGHINTRLGVHTPSTPGDTWYLTINGTNINNGGTNFLQSMNPTAWTFPVRGANTNFVDSLVRQDATGLHAGTNLFNLTGALGEPSFTMGDLGSTTNISIWAQGMILGHDTSLFRVQEVDANLAGIEWSGSIWELVTKFGNVQLKDNFPVNTAHWQPTFPASSQKTWLGSSTNWWDGIYAGSAKMFQFFDVVIDPGVSTNLNFAVDGVTYNIGAGGGLVGGTTINPTDYKVPYRLNAGAFGDTGMHPTNVNDMVFDGAVYLTTAAYDQYQFTNVDGVLYIRNQPRITNAILSQVITLDGLAYNFPTAHDRAGSVLMDYDNAGTLTWSGSITNPLYNIYLSNVWVNGSMASGINPTRWKVPYNADGTNFLDTGMHPTNTTDVIFDGKIYSGADATLSLEKLTGYSWAFTTTDGAGRSQIQFNNPNNGGNSFSVGATGGGAGELTTSGSSIGMGLSGNLFTWQAGSFTASSPINFGGPLNPNLSAWWSQTNFTKELVVTNGITLGGVRATAWPSGTVTYAAVTNALLATGSASDVLHGDGSWGAGGGGTSFWVTNELAPGFVFLVPTNSGTALGTLIGDINTSYTWSVLDGPFGLSVGATDGTDTIYVAADSALAHAGTSLFVNSEDIAPFKRTGTDITTRTAGDTVTLTGELTVTNAAPLTTPALEVFGGMRIFRFETATNYTISITNHMVTATADCTLTLPSAAAVGNGFQLILKAKSTVSTAVTITPDGTDTIDGASGSTNEDPRTSVILVSDGVSDWELVAFFISI